MCVCLCKTHNLKLQVVSQAGRAVHPNQHCILLLGAKADSQPVSSCARSVVGRPCVHNEPSITSEYVCGSRCRTRKREKQNIKSKNIKVSGKSISSLHVCACVCMALLHYTKRGSILMNPSECQTAPAGPWLLNYSPYVTLATLMSPGAPVSAEAWAKQSRSRYNHSTHATPPIRAQGWLSWLQPLCSPADTPDNQSSPTAPRPPAQSLLLHAFILPKVGKHGTDQTAIPAQRDAC